MLSPGGMRIITKGNNATNTSRTRIKPIWRGGFPGAGRRAHRTGITSIAFVYAFSRGPLSPVGAVPPVKRAIRRTLSCSFWRSPAHTGPQQIWNGRLGLKMRPHCTHFFSSIWSRKRRPHFSHFLLAKVIVAGCRRQGCVPCGTAARPANVRTRGPASGP